MRTFLQLIEGEVRVFCDTVKMALLGKLNPDQISYQQLAGIADFIYALEDEHNLESPLQQPADLFSMPLTYLYNLEEQRLEFIIHVPMYKAEQLLDMYEHQPFPMTMGLNRDYVAVPRPGAHNILAYNSKSEFHTMTTTDLQSCYVLRRVHYCPNRQVLRTDWSKTCLSALFKMNQVAATRYCDFQIQPADERVLKLEATKYLVYTNRQLVAEEYCGSKHKTLSITEGTVLNVGPGCRIKLAEHQIYGESSFTKTFQEPSIFNWNWDAQRVLRNHSGPQLLDAIANLQHEAGMTSFETEDLLQQMEIQQLQLQVDILKQERLDLQLNNPLSMFHWIGIGISALVTFITVTALAVCARRYVLHLLAPHRASSANQPALANIPAIEMAASNPTPARGLFRIF